MKTANADVRGLFDRNAATYDRVNSVISLGMDAAWRSWVARHAVMRPGASVLDAFAGTGLVGLRAALLGAHVTLADVSPEMLAVANARAREARLPVTIVEADLTSDTSAVIGAPFDAITVSFALRYVDEPAKVLASLARMLNPEGRIVLLDFVEPEPSLVSSAAAFYFFHVLPKLAGRLAGSRELYDRLIATTHRMGPREHLLEIVARSGLEVIETRVMGFGLVLGVCLLRS